MVFSPLDTAQRREVIILANPMAGSQGSRSRVQELLCELRARQMETILCHKREELSDLVATRGDRLRCVVAAGGDGTLNEVLNRVPGTPVTILPLGNENLVARHFGLSRSASKLASLITSRAPRRLDLGRTQDRLFSLMIGAGIDAQVVHVVHQARRGHISKWTYVLPTIRALLSYRYPVIDVLIEETNEQLRGTAVFLFNLPMYGLGLPIGGRALADDGLLDLLVFQRPGFLNLARYFAAILMRRHYSLSDVVYRRVKRVRLSSVSPVPVQMDGDPAGLLPLTVEAVPGAWTLLAGS